VGQRLKILALSSQSLREAFVDGKRGLRMRFLKGR
jgi:hypothetical protein